MAGWIKALHIIGLILWMGGLFHLARHLGQHAELESPECREAFSAYESKTYYIGVLPGFLITLLTGLYAFLKGGAGTYLTSDAWGGTFHLKLLLVVILIGLDQFVHFKMRKLHDGGEAKRGPFMAIHGVVGLSFIVIVFIMTTRALAG